MSNLERLKNYVPSEEVEISYIFEIKIKSGH